MSPSRGAGLPCRPRPRRVCLQETGAKKQRLLWRSDPQMERGGIPPRLPSPHLITSHQHLGLTTPREKPADTGRGKCRGHPWQAEPGRGGDVRSWQGPARQGQRCWASFYPHRNSHALRQESLFTRSSDMENEVQKGSKKIAHGLLQLRYLGIRTNLSCLRFKLSNSVFSPDRRAG